MLYIKHSCLAREDQPLPINIGERTHLTACPLTDAVIHAQRHIIISNKPAPIGAGCLLLLSPVVRSRQTAREQLLSLRCCRAAQRRALGQPTEQSPAPEARANQRSCLHPACEGFPSPTMRAWQDIRGWCLVVTFLAPHTLSWWPRLWGIPRAVCADLLLAAHQGPSPVVLSLSQHHPTVQHRPASITAPPQPFGIWHKAPSLEGAARKCLHPLQPIWDRGAPAYPHMCTSGGPPSARRCSWAGASRHQSALPRSPH